MTRKLEEEFNLPPMEDFDEISKDFEKASAEEQGNLKHKISSKQRQINALENQISAH